jgi:hypothetical protein
LQSNPISAFSFQNFNFCLVTVPPLDDWEKEWGKNPQRNAQPKLLPVDFRPPPINLNQLDSFQSKASLTV